MKSIMDKILIRNLKVETIIGTFKKERKEKQTLILNLELRCELRKAGLSDKLEDTVDYKAVENQIKSFVEESKFKLIESVAEKTAELCLKNPGVHSVKVTVDKLGALRFAESVAVEIER